MPEYDFTLLIDGPDSLTDELEDKLFEAGCDDGTISISGGRLSLTFTREAESLKDAIVSAIKDVRKADIGTVNRVDECSLISATPIVDAWIEKENLVVLSPTFERLTVPLKQLKEFIGSDLSKAREFQIDEDGSFLYWEHTDVHLGWEQFLQLINPHRALAAQQKTEAFNKRYGAAIKLLREEHGITQSSIDGLTDRHLRRIEQGQQQATKASLEVLARAHEMEIAKYMNELAKRLASEGS